MFPILIRDEIIVIRIHIQIRAKTRQTDPH
jgi:hypothetical protein